MSASHPAPAAPAPAAPAAPPVPAPAPPAGQAAWRTRHGVPAKAHKAMLPRKPGVPLPGSLEDTHAVARKASQWLARRDAVKAALAAVEAYEAQMAKHTGATPRLRRRLGRGLLLAHALKRFAARADLDLARLGGLQGSELRKELLALGGLLRKEMGAGAGEAISEGLKHLRR